MPTVLAPAKLNLTLEVLAKCPDGFHEIRSVIQTISLCDNLTLKPNQSIDFKCDMPEWLPEKSLISKAISLLQESTRCSKGVMIGIKKRIPLISGLGGDSSGAAAALRGLNRLWGLGLSLSELLKLASQLGSDIAFFLYGGTALIKGRGEIITPLPPPPHRWLVLAIPPLPRAEGKTRRLYNSLKTSHYSSGQTTDEMVARLIAGKEVLTSGLFNVFESIAFDIFDRLGEYQKQFLKAGAQEVHLAGSGPTLFTMLEDKAEAERIYQNLCQQGLEPYLVETLTDSSRGI